MSPLCRQIHGDRKENGGGGREKCGVLLNGQLLFGIMEKCWEWVMLRLHNVVSVINAAESIH